VTLERLNGGGTTTPDAHDAGLIAKRRNQNGSKANSSHYSRAGVFHLRGRPNA